MRRFTAILLIFIAGLSASAQESGSTPVSRQGGSCAFIPDNIVFFKEASKEFGVIPSIIFTSDRITRSNRIGMSGKNMAAADGKVHEGIEAYSLKKRLDTPSLAGEASPLKALAKAGGPHASQDFDFVNYLIGNNMGGDAYLLLSREDYYPSDTLNYLRGWTAYSTKELEQACAEFSQVGPDSPFYDKSLFFNVISNAHIGNYDRSEELLNSYTGPQKELKSFEEAGIALLKNDQAAFRTAAAIFTLSQYALTESEEQLWKIYNERFFTKSKSPAVAAAASALVPGAGKIYAGELGEGISSFVICGALAALTAENWIKSGPTNWKTILFGTVGAVFYLGNIYGSYVSVSIHNNFITNEQDTAILYHIHIPLRSVFK